jgi:hypothetical protein
MKFSASYYLKKYKYIYIFIYLFIYNRFQTWRKAPSVLNKRCRTAGISGGSL